VRSLSYLQVHGEGTRTMKGDESGECEVEALVVPRSGDKSDQVRDVFEDTPRYLKSRRVDIRCRIDVVKGYASTLDAKRMLDIGCGDGTISLQLVTKSSRLTLMDLSSSMIATARENIPKGLEDMVELRNENFATASFDSEQFDLIVSVGVMAHVESPDAFLSKIKSLLRPGGSLILEFTDAFHVVGRVGRFWSWLRELLAPAKYRTNKLSFAEVARLFDRHNLKLVSTYRYSRVPLPMFNKFVSHDAEYRLVKRFFGRCMANRNAWLGNEYICLLTTE